MESLFILIPIAIVFVIIAVLVFMWAVKSGQFEDLDTEGKRILFDEDHEKKVRNSKRKVSNNDTDKEASDS